MVDVGVYVRSTIEAEASARAVFDMHSLVPPAPASVGVFLVADRMKVFGFGDDTYLVIQCILLNMAVSGRWWDITFQTRAM